MLSLTVRGTPFLYAGEELGLADAVVPADRSSTPTAATAAGRRSRGPPTATTRPATAGRRGRGCPFPANAATHNAEAEIGVAGSTHSLYRDLLSLRRASPALRRGSMELAPLDGAVIRYTRTLGADRVDVAVNTGDAATPWPDGLDGELLISTDPARTSVGGDLAACEAVVVRPARPRTVCVPKTPTPGYSLTQTGAAPPRFV